MQSRVTYIHWKFRNWPFALRLSVIICLIVSLIMALISINSYRLYRKAMHEQVENLVPKMLS